jgi:hypothetical protein
MVSKKISKNDENEEITEEEKNILKQMYLEAQQKEEEEVIQQKPKRQISDAQREALARAREMAVLKKNELKEISDKKKAIQTIKKEEKKLDVEKEYKETIQRFQNKKEPERKIKKIIYEDEEDENDNKKISISELTKKSAMEQMKDRINEDRLKILYQKYILR